MRQMDIEECIEIAEHQAAENQGSGDEKPVQGNDLVNSEGGALPF